MRLATVAVIPGAVILVVAREAIAYRANVVWRLVPDLGLTFTETTPLDNPQSTEDRFLRRIWLELAAR